MLSKIRYFIIKCPLVVLTLGFITVFEGCVKDKTVSDINKHTIANNIKSQLRVPRPGAFSNEDLFRSVFFFDGVAGGLMGNLQILSVENEINNQTISAYMRLFEDSLIMQISAQNPGYMSSFGTNITSGDYATVQQTLTDGGNLIYNTCVAWLNNGISPNNQTNQNFVTSFMQTYGITNQSTPAVLANAVSNSFAVNVGSSGGPVSALPSWLYRDQHVAVQEELIAWFGVAIAAVAVLVLEIGLIKQNGPIIGLPQNQFIFSEMSSTITVNFNGI
ncbi:MAG: hypothetical protein P4L41_08260 [Flavipsychrobacter sp.]|nr:hypothetical protein [Flavipsychrobacter sp.]